MIEKIKWLGHASFRIEAGKLIYIDPWKIKEPDKADMVLVSHAHFDHFSQDDINKLATKATTYVVPADVASQLKAARVPGNIRSVSPGDRLEVDNIEITAVASYNINKSFHPRGRNWLGFIINIDGKNIYYAGDTDAIPEMAQLKDKHIEVALLPVGGTYTMNSQEAADMANVFKPKIVVPYHWGDIIGERVDAEEFQRLFTQGDTVILPH